MCDSYTSDGALPLDDITSPLGLISENASSKLKRKTKKKKKKKEQGQHSSSSSEDEDDMQ